MKKILLLFLFAVAALGLAACTGKTNDLKVSETSVTIDVGQTKSLDITVSKDALANLEVQSSNTAVATVKIEGSKLSITAVSVGSAVATLKIKDTDKQVRVNISVRASETGARFEGHTNVFYIDVSQPLETEVQEALSVIKAYDADGTEIVGDLMIEGIDQIDVTAGAGTQFKLQISVLKKDGSSLVAVVTVQLIGEAVAERVVIYGPAKLTYFVGSTNFDFEKEFSALNITTKEVVPITAQFQLPRDLVFSTPGRHVVTIHAEDGLISAERNIEVFVKAKVELKQTLSSSSAEAPIKISFGHGNGQDIEALFNKYAVDFEKAMLAQGHHVKVEVRKVGANYDEVRDAMTSAMQSGTELPNIIQNYPDHLVEYHGYGKIISLTPYVFDPVWGFGSAANESWYDIVQSYRDEQRAASAEGDLLSMPFNKSTELIIYNKDMFDDVLQGKAFPETWEDLMALAPALRAQIDSNLARIAQAYQTAGVTTFTAEEQQKARDQFYPFSYDSGGNAFITLTKAWEGQYTAQGKLKTDKLLFNNDQTKAMLKFFGDNRSEFTTPAVWDNARYATDLFLKGYSAFSVSSSAGADKNTPMVPSKTTKLFNPGLAPMLYSKHYPGSRNVIQQGTNFAITTEGNEDQKIVSWLFLKFLNSVEISLDYALEKGYFPTRYSTLESPGYVEFRALAKQNITSGMSRLDADKIMRAKAAEIYFEQKDYMVFDLPFKGSSGVRGKVEVAFKDVMLAPKTDDIVQKIIDVLNTAYNESLRLVTDD